MAVLLALVPILLLLVLMVGLRWSAASAGLAGAAAAAAVATLGFGYGATAPLPGLIGPLAEAAFTALTILWIVFGALAIHEYQIRSGGLAVFAEWLGRYGGDRGAAALFVGWFFALFLEGAAGFGTPVALAAPLLVGLGVSPVRALTAVLAGHAAGVSFGAVGTPVVPLLAAAPVDAAALSLSTVLLHACLGWALAALVVRIAAGSGDWRLAAGAWAAFFVPAALLAWTTGPELPTLGGAIVGGALFALVLRGRGAGPDAARLAAAALPYLLVIALVLATRLVPPLREALGGARLDWRLWEDFGAGFSPLYHPGTFLVLAFLAAGLVRKEGSGLVAQAALAAAARLPKVALALVSVLLIARLMIHSGMIAELAVAAAAALGPGWPLAAPLVGAAGSFVTGSATASNILFADFQSATAAAAGLSPLLLLAGQGFGSGIGNIVAPHNIVAGAATVGLVGAEGKVLKRTLPICLLYSAAGGTLLVAAQLALGGRMG
jgi:lactate permease